MTRAGPKHLAAILLLLMATPSAWAYDAAAPDGGRGYGADSRVLHDCSDDYDGIGHDLVALDIKEAGGAVYFYLTYGRGPESTEDRNPGNLPNPNVPYRLYQISFDTPHGTHETGAWIHYDQYQDIVGYASHDGIRRTPFQPPAPAGGLDTSRRVLEVWFEHDNLGVRDGEQLTNIQVKSRMKAADNQPPEGDPDLDTRWSLEDIMPPSGATDAASAGCTGPPESEGFLVRNHTIAASTVLNQAPTVGLPVVPSTTTYTGDPVTFSATASDPDGDALTAWEWDLGDGPIRREQSPTHSYQESGSYTVTVRVRDALGAWSPPASTQFTVENQLPVAAVLIEPRSPVVGEVVNFTDLSSDPDGTIVSSVWNFGDGATSGDRQAIHAYSIAGTFTATLTVRDDDGATSQISRDIVVRPRDGSGPADLPPGADFDYAPSAPLQGNPVQFTDRSIDPEGRMASYQWDFGDGARSHETNPVHIFEAPGTFTVLLTVTDAAGQSATRQRPLTVTGVETRTASVVPDFGFSPETIRIGSNVAFFDQSSADGTTIVAYQWNFGDGSPPKSEANPVHVFQHAGTYTVTLTLTDASGQQHRVTNLLEVRSNDSDQQQSSNGADGGGRGIPGISLATLVALSLALVGLRRRHP